MHCHVVSFSARRFGLAAATLAALAGSALAQCPTQTKLIGSPADPDGHFGAAVAMSFGGPNSSPLLAVGNPKLDSPGGMESGGFTVFQRVNGWSVLYSAWNATGLPGDRLGESIGLSDPFLITGSPGFNNNQGRAVIFRRSAGTSSYVNPVTLTGFSPNQGDGFGTSVAISSINGGWAVVGAPMQSFGGVQGGSVYFYVRNTSTNAWTNELTFRGGDFGGANFEMRGQSVAMSQSSPYAAVGQPNAEDANQPANHGSVIIVQLLSNRLPGAPTIVRPPSPEADEHFGASVAIEGDLLVVGAPDEDLTLLESGLLQAAVDGGAVYVFRFNGTSSWDFVQKFRAPTVTAGGHFGARVATDGQRIVVAESGANRAHVFSLQANVFKHQFSLGDPDSAASGDYASGVAVRGDDVAVGDQLDDHSAVVNPGAVYTVIRSAAAQVGDTCSNPIPFVPGAGDQTGCTTLATPSGFNATSCGTGGAGQGPDVFYTFTATCDGNVTLDTFGSSFDTVLSAHSACPNSIATQVIACNDDASFAAPNNRASLITFNVVAGQTYLVRLTGYNGASGAYTLRSLFFPSIINDTCATALSVPEGTTPFSTACATNDPAAFGVLYPGSAMTNAIWFRHTAAQTGQLTFDTCGSTFDTVLEIYSGPACPAGASSALAGNDDSGASACGVTNSRRTINAAAGQQFLVRVGGYFSGSSGLGQFTVTLLPTPACQAEYNGDGALNTDDISDYITDYFSVPPVAGPGGYALACPGAPSPYTISGYKVDINGDCVVNTDDVSDYITAYFTGC